MTRIRNPWLRVGCDAWALGLEASAVIALRTLKMAAGGEAGAAEAHLMVTEKLDAAAALQAKAMTGRLGLNGPSAATATLAHYRRKVRANRRRLSKT
jgi:hypothetical protein